MAALPPLQSLSKEAVLAADGSIDAERFLYALNQFVGPTYGALNRQLTFGENFAAVLKTVRVVTPAVDFVAPTLQNSWANYSGFDTAGYRIDDRGAVSLKGVIAGGTTTAGTVLFTLPEGYRPSARKMLIAENTGADGRVDIRTSGDVTIEQGSNTYLSLENIHFFAKTPASPPAFSGSGWPLIVAHGLPKASGVLPVRCVRLNGTAPAAASVNALDWQDKGDGQIVVRRVYGLAPEAVYQLTLLIFAG